MGQRNMDFFLLINNMYRFMQHLANRLPRISNTGFKLPLALMMG